MANLQEALIYIKSFYGQPYIWGGDDPAGFDCSGLAVEYLKALGAIKRKSDYTAKELCALLKPTNKAEPGNLVFFNYDGKISHVEILITKDLCIGASGGGPHITDSIQAFEHNAYIKLRPMIRRCNQWVIKLPECRID